MSDFNYNPKQRTLYVYLPKTFKFDYAFHSDMSDILNRSLDSKDSIEEVLIYCEEGSVYEKMCKAYLLNIIRFLMKKKEVKWHRNLANIIIGIVVRRDGAKFTEIDINKEIIKDNLIYYDFKGDKDVGKPVNEMAKILVEKNLTINSETVKEFLSTTIGEIFSNSINHSDQDEIFFMYDILYEKSCFYLNVNIIDYGTTIVSNVKRYFSTRNIQMNDCIECLSWAIQTGNTTRDGSGGYGLPTLISYIKNTKGELLIFSDNASLHLCKNGDLKTEQINGIFFGTSITFKVKLYDTNRAIKYDESLEQLVSIGLDSI